MSTQIGNFKRTSSLALFLWYFSTYGLIQALKFLYRRIMKGHWSVYIDEMGTSVSVTTTLAAMTGSPYSPLTDGRLRQVILTCSGDAATALIEGGHVELTATSFAGVEVHVPFAGAGIRTAPAFPIPITIVDCDVPVKTGVTIKLQIINETGDTPVTPRYAVFGVFEG